MDKKTKLKAGDYVKYKGAKGRLFKHVSDLGAIFDFIETNGGLEGVRHLYEKDLPEVVKIKDPKK